MAKRSGGKERAYTEADLQRLLGLLDQDPVKAQLGYNGLRERLEWLFERYEVTRCEAAEKADETIDRLILQLNKDQTFRPDNIYSYSAGIARMIVRESYRGQRFGPLPPHPPDPGGTQEVSPSEQLMVWLEDCLAMLPERDRELIIEYYAREGRAKVDWRQSAAAVLNKSEATFRVAVFRIRKRLQKCIEQRRRGEGG